MVASETRWNRRAGDPLTGADQGPPPEQVGQRAGLGEPGADVEAEQRGQHRRGAEGGEQRAPAAAVAERFVSSAGERGGEQRDAEQGRVRRCRSGSRSATRSPRSPSRPRPPRRRGRARSRAKRRVRGAGHLARPHQPACAGPHDEHQARPPDDPGRRDVPAGTAPRSRPASARPRPPGRAGTGGPAGSPCRVAGRGELAAEQQPEPDVLHDQHHQQHRRHPARRSRRSRGRGGASPAGW